MAISILKTEGNDHADQPNAVLETKLYIPQPRPKLVPRPNLIARLNDGIQRKLTLISAPAGFGKTTLLIDWINQTGIPVSWISLDAEDGNSLRFMTYLLAAVQKVEPTVGKLALETLHSSQPLPIESVLTNLINEIASIPNRFVIVLEDYHLIDEKQIHDIIEFLLDHLPQNMHVVIATRSDPPLSLARLRSRNHLSEFRASDLNFKPNETTDFLNRVMTLDLSKESIAVLESRTEGWIAGLQLAALSMQGRDDIPAFIDDFTGHDRHIVDYLVEEVLSRQSDDIRDFLLNTSILDRFSGSLCDAITEQEDSDSILNELEKGNLFIVPLDNKRHWYRYHHLFGDLLKQLLKQKYGDIVPELHSRASEWFGANGLESEALHHAVAAEDFERAAGLVELAWPAMERRSQSATWLSWVKKLPDELIHNRPVLCVAYASALQNTGQLEAAELRLRDAEKCLELTAHLHAGQEVSSTKMVVVDEEQFRSLPASIALFRAYYAQAIGDVPSTMKYAQRVHDLLPDEEQLTRGYATILLGIAYWASGDLKAAHLCLDDHMTQMLKTDNIHDAISITFVLAEIKVTLGRLQDALRTYERSLQLATIQGEPMHPSMQDLHRGIVELHSEHGDLEAAQKHILISQKLSERVDLPDWQHRFCVTKARLKKAEGNLDGALSLLDEAERHYIRTPLPNVRPIAALKTRIWIAQGRLAKALGWMRESELSIDDDLSYLREFEHITLARVLIAKHTNDPVDGAIHDAKELLERLLLAAEEGGRIGSVIEILVVQALAHEAVSDRSPAFVSLERALTLAEPEGYARTFLDEGPPMAELLEQALNANVDFPRAYAKKLLTTYKVNAVSKTDGGLLNPLTEREVEVLHLMAARLSNKEIAEQLYISLNTVKTHVKKTISKLGADNRSQAVAQAKKLGLL